MVRILLFLFALSAQASDCNPSGGEPTEQCDAGDCKADAQTKCENAKQSECEQAGLKASCMVWRCSEVSCSATCTDCRCLGAGASTPLEDDDIYM